MNLLENAMQEVFKGLCDAVTQRCQQVNVELNMSCVDKAGLTDHFYGHYYNFWR